MNIPDENEGTHIPEDDDPVYDNPIGRLPEKPTVPEHTQQPFDFLLEGDLHSDAERKEFERRMAEDQLPAVRTLLTKQAYKTLAAFRARREAAHLKTCKHGASEQEVSEGEREMDMYDRAAEIWAAELGLFMEKLRGALAEQLLHEFSKYIAFDLASELRNREV
jgi:hypothetical protein